MSMDSKGNDILWWGYRHTNGSLQVKRYFDRLDIQEAHESPFCGAVCGPFTADGRMDALEQAGKLV